jgi:hypothetical protein
MDYSPKTVRLDQLLLDPNNYRFFDMEKYAKVSSKRVHEDTVQDKAEELIKLDGKEELRALKESIQVNGYVPIETIVVFPYKYKNDTYVVIEGNRRVAAMRWIQKDQEGGSQVSKELVDSFARLPIVILSEDADTANALRHVLMGLRHVSGIKQWGGYQRAKLVVELVDDFHLSLTDAAKQIGMSPHEASRRYRALKALEQMQTDDKFGTSADSKMYRLFHEAISVVKIKEWLKWDDDQYRFTDQDNLENFYRLLVPYMPEEEEEAGRARDPKIRTYLDVRDLREILGNIEAEECLFDPDRSFSDALAVAKASATLNWTPRIQAALQTLNKMPVTTLKALTPHDVRPLCDLFTVLKGTLNDWEKLTRNKLEL